MRLTYPSVQNHRVWIPLTGLCLVTVGISRLSEAAPNGSTRRIYQTPSAIASYGPNSNYRATYTPSPTPTPAPAVSIPPAPTQAPVPKYTSNAGIYQDSSPGTLIYTGTPESNGPLSSPGDPILDPTTVPREITIEPQNSASPR